MPQDLTPLIFFHQWKLKELKGSHLQIAGKIISNLIKRLRFQAFRISSGPNSALGHNSVILMIEAQVNYIVKCLKKMRKNGWTSLDPKSVSQDKFNNFIQKRLQGTVWQGSCSSWYKDDDEQNFTIWPLSATRYMLSMRKPDFSEYNVK